MKKSVIALCVFTLVAGLYAGYGKKKSDVDEVRAVLESYIKAWNSLDADMYMLNFAKSEDLLIFNSNPAVTYQGWQKMNELVHKAFSDRGKAEVKFRDPRIGISAPGKTAWLTCYLDGTFESGDKAQCMKGIRTTWILEKQDGRWLIVHSHWSLGADEKKE